MTRAFLILGIVAAVMFGIHEIRQWSSRADYVSPKQRRIRGLGLFFLLASLGLWLHGTYLPVPETHGGQPSRAVKVAALGWIAYWTVTFVALVPLVPLALLDTREGLQRVSAERRKILKDALTVVDTAGDTSNDKPSA